MKPSQVVRVIGDIHGNLGRYKILTKKRKSIQVGDFGFREDWDFLKTRSPEEHLVLPGNHDDYSVCLDHPNSLGNYGMKNFHGLEFFFVRGGLSMDKHLREPGVDYWENEELSDEDVHPCLELYMRNKPKIVITHDCPYSVYKYLGVKNPTICLTNSLLEAMFFHHSPKVWIFGHHHTKLHWRSNNCLFFGLDSCEAIDIKFDPETGDLLRIETGG